MESGEHARRYDPRGGTRRLSLRRRCGFAASASRTCQAPAAAGPLATSLFSACGRRHHLAIGGRQGCALCERFSHDDESARRAVPRAAEIRRQRRIDAPPAIGIGRFTYPTAQPATMLIRTSDTQIGSSDASVDVDAANRTITGSVTSGNFCGYLSPAGRHSYYTLHFVAIFDRPFTAHGTWQGKAVTRDSTSSRGHLRTGPRDTRRPAQVRAPMSGSRPAAPSTCASASRTSASRTRVPTSRPILPRGRRWNRWPRGRREAWNQIARRIQVSGGDACAADHLLHRALPLAPAHERVQRRNGEYRGFDQKVHACAAAASPVREFLRMGRLPLAGPARRVARAGGGERHGAVAPQPGRSEQRRLGSMDAQQRRHGRHGRGPPPPTVASIAAFGGTDFDMKARVRVTLKRAATVPTALDLSDAGCRVMCPRPAALARQMVVDSLHPHGLERLGRRRRNARGCNRGFRARTIGPHDRRPADARRVHGALRLLAQHFQPGADDRRGGPRPSRRETRRSNPRRSRRPAATSRTATTDGTWPPLDPASSSGFAEGSARSTRG